MNEKEKAKLAGRFAQTEETTSINPDSLDTSPLLSGDANEEQRLKPVLEEKKKATINGKLDRITAEEI